MKRIDLNRPHRLTEEDLSAFYPQALTVALECLLPVPETGPERDPLLEKMRAYLDTVRERVIDRSLHPGDTLAMSIMILRRMQLDGVTPLFQVKWGEESKSKPFEEREFRLDVIYSGDLRVLGVALWLTLDAMVKGEKRYQVDTSGATGERLALLNEASALVPRISINMEEAVPLHSCRDDRYAEHMHGLPSACTAKAHTKRDEPMQEHEAQKSSQFTYPVGCNTELREALPYFAMIVCGVIKAWNTDSIPYPQHPKLRDLLKAFAGPQVTHVQATSGDGAAEELERLARLFSEVFERMEADMGTFPSNVGNA